MKIKELKQLKKKGELKKLPYRRRSINAKRIIKLLDNEALRPNEIAKRLNLEYQNTFSTCRRLEHRGLLTAFLIKGYIHYVSNNLFKELSKLK